MRQKELKTADWQRNLKIAWIGTFFTGASFSIVMPFMALYVEELGVKGAMVEWYACSVCPSFSLGFTSLGTLGGPLWPKTHDDKSQYGHDLYNGRLSLCA